MAIEQQMEMFGTGDMGRLNDDGMMNDPVSGNPIPPGSMANEVRDDVDAKLSDGEYVVPANVVRYYGVKFFEDLRNDAMQGLATMEATGRIGGEPVPAEMPMKDQMAGAANELSEQDMAMLQSMMNEGGVVQGYANGGGVDPVTGKPIPQAIPTSYYPISQFITPGASTISSGLNPYVAPPATTEPPITTMPIDSDSTVRYVTYEKPGTGEIRVIAFKGDTPVNPDEVTSAIEAGYFPQGSSELESAKQEMSRDPEQDQSVDDGTKPPNRQTVGELLWSVSRGTYNDAFPDSLSAGVSKLGSAFGTGKVLGSILPDGPSALEASIKEAKERLASGKDYQGVAINAAEKAALELLAGLDPTADPKVIYDTIYNAYGIHLGGSQKGKYKRDIRKPDLKKATKVEQEVKKASKRLDARDSTGTKFTKYEYDDNENLTYKGRQDLLDDVETKYNIELQSRGTTPTQPRSNFRDDDDNSQGTTASVTTPNTVTYSGEDDKGRPTGGKAKDESVTAFENTAGGRFMNKGGLLKKPTKKTKTKK